MADKNSSPTEEPANTKTSNKWVAFWVGIGIFGLLLLAGTNAFIIHQSRSQFLQGWTSPTNMMFRDLTVDPQGKVWGLNLSEGIASLNTGGQFEWVALDNELIDGHPQSLALDSKGRIWVGTDDAVGMRELNGEWRIFTPKNHIEDARIFDIVVDGQDRAWIKVGWYGASGLGVIDPASDTGATYTFSNSGLDGKPYAIAADQQGRIWCMNKDHQLMILGSDGNWEQRGTLPVDPEAGSSLAIDQQGLAWVGSNGRVYHLGTDNQWTTYSIGDKGTMNTIEVLVIDHQGRVWAGSGYQGIFMFDAPLGWTTYNSKNSGLTNDSITAMAVDGADKVWIVTTVGLSQFDAGTALSPAVITSNQEAAQKFNTLKNSLPIFVFGIVLIAILGIALTAPQVLGAIKSALLTRWKEITLWLIMITTIIMGMWIRTIGVGWGLLVFGIPLLIIGILHFVFQVSAIRRVSKMKPSYIPMILLSNLFFFLGFALQVDAGDGSGYLAIAVFYGHYISRESWDYVLSHQPAGLSIYMFTSIAFLVALIASWFFLRGKHLLKQENGD